MTQLKNKGYIYKVTNIITGQRSSYIGNPEADLAAKRRHIHHLEDE